MCKTIKPITDKKREKGEEGSREEGRGFKKKKRRKEGEREVGWT